MKTDARDGNASNSSNDHFPAHPHYDEHSRIRIKVRGMADGEHRVDFECDAALLDYPGYQDSIHIFGSLTTSSEQIHVQVGVSAKGSFECTRCMDPFSKNIEVLLKLEFVSPRLERDPEDPNVHVYDSGESAYIDITDDVRDALALAIPMRNLCKPNCKGLCPVCGTNLNRLVGEHVHETEQETRFPALKSLSERLRAEEKNAGRQK